MFYYYLPLCPVLYLVPVPSFIQIIIISTSSWFNNVQPSIKLSQKQKSAVEMMLIVDKESWMNQFTYSNVNPSIQYKLGFIAGIWHHKALHVGNF